MSLWKNIDSQSGKPKFIALGQVQAISLLTAGTGYTDGTVGATISAPAAGGVQATANVTILGGIVTGIVITNPGSGYVSAPTVSVTSGGGTGATFSAAYQGTARNTSGQTNLNSAIVFVDFEESQKTDNRIKGIRIPGWNRVFSKVVDGNTRYSAECLVAMRVLTAVSGDGADDLVVADVEFSFSTQPTTQTVTAPGAATFSVTTSTGSSTFQWQLQTNIAGPYVNVSNGGVYSGVTTSSLVISNSTGLNNNRYRVVALNSTANASITSNGAKLIVS